MQMQTFTFQSFLAHFIWMDTPYVRIKSPCSLPGTHTQFPLAPTQVVLYITSAFILWALSFLFLLMILRCTVLLNFINYKYSSQNTNNFSEFNNFQSIRGISDGDGEWTQIKKNSLPFFPKPGLWMMLLYKSANSGKTHIPGLFLPF